MTRSEFCTKLIIVLDYALVVGQNNYIVKCCDEKTVILIAST